MATALDDPTLLERLARHAVTEFADGCAIDLWDEDGTVTLAARAATGVMAETMLQQASAVLHDERDSQTAFHDGLAAGQTCLLPAPAVGMVAPMLAGERVLGTITVVTADAARDRRTFSPADLPVAEALARRVALALDNMRLYRAAQAAIQVREEFLSIASHELKTPLTTVLGWAQLLNGALHQPELDRPQLEAFTGELTDQADRLRRLVDDLLDVSRLQQGQLELRRTMVDLTTLAQRVLARCEHAVECTPAHRLIFEAEAATGSYDADRLDQVLTNLVTNALKYSPAGGKVIVRISQTAHEITIAVSDQGIGIAPEEQADVFAPFVRTTAGPQAAAGSGLGLYISARIVAQHGGRLALASTLGQGSTFSMHLPVVEA